MVYFQEKSPPPCLKSLWDFKYSGHCLHCPPIFQVIPPWLKPFRIDAIISTQTSTVLWHYLSRITIPTIPVCTMHPITRSIGNILLLLLNWIFQAFPLQVSSLHTSNRVREFDQAILALSQSALTNNNPSFCLHFFIGTSHSLLSHLTKLLPFVLHYWQFFSFYRLKLVIFSGIQKYHKPN